MAQCPMRNSEVFTSFSHATSGLDRSADNATKFAVFRENRGNCFERQQGTASDHFKPDCRFIQFLEHDFEPVNEISAAFCAARLAIIGGAGGSGSQNLAADMSALRRPRQFAG